MSFGIPDEHTPPTAYAARDEAFGSRRETVNNLLNSGESGQGSKPRVLFIAHTAVPGGSELSLLRLLQHLDCQQFEPIVLLFSGGDVAQQIKALGIEVHYLRLPVSVTEMPRSELNWRVIFKWWETLLTIRQVVRVACFVRKHRVSIVHTYSLKASLVAGLGARLAGRPLIWHVHQWITKEFFPSFAVRASAFFARRLATIVVANSRSTLKAFLPVRQRASAVVYPGVDQEQFERAAASHVDDGGVCVGLVGRISPIKGQEVFLKAARLVIREMPNVRFQVVGSALFNEQTYEREVHRLAAQLELNGVVKFVGFCNAIPELMASLTIAVHAATAPEPFGQVLVEAMAAGKPVVASNAGGVAEIVVDGVTGWLVSPGNAEELAECILRLLRDPEAARKMGEEGKKRVREHFTIAATARQLEGVYRSVIQAYGTDGAGESHVGAPRRLKRPIQPGANLRIGINAHLLSFGASYRSTGVSNYIRHLLQGLGTVDRINEYTIYGGRSGREDVARSLELPENFSGKGSLWRNERTSIRILWEQTPLRFRRTRLDVLHGPVNIIPILTDVPRVVTVHDLAFRRVLHSHPFVQREYLDLMTRLSVRSAQRIVAVSQWTKRDLIELYNVPESKVVVIPEAAGEEYRPLSQEGAKRNEVEHFRQKRNLPKRFFFYLGTLEPRKNIPALIEAYATLAERRDWLRRPTDDVPRLIVAGPKGWGYESIFRAVRERGLDGLVLFPGYLPKDEIVLWFNAAMAFVYLSTYEGFGLPPLQAMACGIPTIVNDATSLPEVVGQAGFCVDAANAEEVALRMEELADSPERRRELSDLGLAQAGRFSWENAAKQTLRVYEEAARDV